MIITLCGSIAFIDEMAELKAKLEKIGFDVLMPPLEVPGENGDLIPAKEYYNHKKSMHLRDNWIWDRHSDRIEAHFEKVAKSDAVLVANYDKNGIAGYIGANTLMEMGVAFYLKKAIFLLNPTPDIAYREEIVGMKPVIIDGDLSKIVL